MQSLRLLFQTSILVVCFFLRLGISANSAEPSFDEPTLKVRLFRLEYGATIKRVSPGSLVLVWFPVPQSGEHQSVEELESDLPATAQTNIDPTYGNKIRYFEKVVPASAEVWFRADYRIKRHEVRGLNDNAREPVALSEQERRLYLAPNQRVPVGGKPTELLDHLRLPSDPLEVARILYSCVDEHVRYDKSRPGYGNGDALWVCDSRFGNCTDFHSLFISLARSQQIPARFEIGFPLPVERGDGRIAGYHCWAFFHAKDRGWIPVDISEADKHPAMKEYYFGNLTENRVVLSTGRDIALVPKSASPLMNFFVYPHVEVDGKPIDKQQVELKVRYTDEE